ncbi:MAG: hypothetical protein JWL59_1041 [Chthoniobacteraceae bacterium]|nr:hypothetical protein [Chthoniobacteraceae bacterium]
MLFKRARFHAFSLPRRLSRRAFTLLEVMISAVIILMLMLTVYRFVVSTLKSMNRSGEISAQRQSMIGLISMLQTELADLPGTGQNLLLGQPHKFNGRASDTLEWASEAGLGVMTSAAPGNYRASLEIVPSKANPKVLELVLRRWPADKTQKEEFKPFVTLLSPVTSLEIRYFHRQLNEKVDRWTDANSLPLLVYVSIQRGPDEPPYDAVLSVPSANLQR